MNKLLFSVFVLFLSVYQANAQDISLIQRVLAQSPILKNHFVGFSLYDIEAHQFLLGVNEDKHFTPASNTKIFTLFTALKSIGDSIPALHYIEKGDSLLFWGTGDPTFLHPKLDVGTVYNFLSATDKKLFYVGGIPTEEPFYRMGWAMEDAEKHYQPAITGFPIYGNLINQKPFPASDTLFIQLLQDTLHKTVESIYYPKPSKVDTLYAAATQDVLREMMLVSDNFLAEQLMMVAAMNRYGEFHTARLRKEMEATYYAFFTDKTDLYDGSGLSPYNKVTPRSLVELLLLIAEDIPQIESRHYLFAAGGVEGTLKTNYSLKGGPPFLWAKTGTLKGVYCESGYIQTRSGRNLVFSFLHNNFVGTAKPLRKEVARIMTFIWKNF